MSRRLVPFRPLAILAGVVLILVSVWAFVKYSSVGLGTLFGGIALGATTTLTPTAAARAPRWIRVARQRYAGDGSSGWPQQSRSRVDDPATVADRVEAAVTDRLDADVRRRDFDAGPGLVVDPPGERGRAYLRPRSSGRISVAGDADTTALVQVAAEATGLTFKRVPPAAVESDGSPSGLYRVTAMLLAVTVVTAGGLSVAGAAYPTATYNPVEKSVLVSYDALGDMHVLSAHERRVSKAAFLVNALDEKSIEIRMTNSSTALIDHARGADQISASTCVLLDGPQSDAKRARQLRTEFDRARAEVVDALATTRRNASNPSTAAALRKYGTAVSKRPCTRFQTDEDGN